MYESITQVNPELSHTMALKPWDNIRCSKCAVISVLSTKDVEHCSDGLDI